MSFKKNTVACSFLHNSQNKHLWKVVKIIIKCYFCINFWSICNILMCILANNLNCCMCTRLHIRLNVCVSMSTDMRARTLTLFTCFLCVLFYAYRHYYWGRMQILLMASLMDRDFRCVCDLTHCMKWLSGWQILVICNSSQ